MCSLLSCHGAILTISPSDQSCWPANSCTKKLLFPDAQVKSKSDKLARTEEANAELSTLLAAERKAAKLAGAAAQKQLLGSMRRIQYMVSIMQLLVDSPCAVSVCWQHE